MPKYDLGDVVRLARSLDKIVLSRRAEQDRLNMEYEMTDVQDCIATLAVEDFVGTEDYPNYSVDKYRIRYQLDHKQVHDNLFIKLFISSSGQLTLTLCSFHMDR